MFSSIKKISSKYTGLLIRMDDISEHMNWELMDKCETLFDKYQIKPLLGVIPINQDPELLQYSRNDMAAIIFTPKNQIKRIFLTMGETQNFTD